jgi:lactoylglutathione lyase
LDNRWIDGGKAMKYLHSMVRVRDLDASLGFYCAGLGLREVRRMDNAQGKFTLVFLAAAESPEAEIELTHNWGSEEDYGSARNFGHLAFRVEDIYATCAHLQGMGVTINRPPRDGHMAFVRSPDRISIELLQKGDPLPPTEPWASMPNVGVW